MKTKVVLIHKQRLYSKLFDVGEWVTFGSHKKDDVFVEDFAAKQIAVSYRYDGIAMQTKEPFDFASKSIPLESRILLEQKSGTFIYFTNLVEESRKTLKLPYQGVFRVGRDREKNDIVIDMPFVSSRHLIIKCESGVIRVEDENSTNGIFLNGKRVEIARMTSGDVLSILGIEIRLLNNELFFQGVNENLFICNSSSRIGQVESINKNGDMTKLIYHKSPRIQEKLPTEDIILSSPPSKGQKYEKSRGVGGMLIGTGAMAGASLLTGVFSPALLAARGASLVSPIASATNASKTNKRRKKSLEEYERTRQERYGAYIEDQKARIGSIAEVQKRILNMENPPPSECIDTVFQLKRSLWERIPRDRDFLDVRVGMGYEDLCVEVKSRADANGFSMEDDEAEELCAQIVEETRIVDNIPRRIPLLRYNSVGFVGPREQTTSILRNMIISMCVAHSAENVRLVGIFDEEEREMWSPIKWLPHIWDDNMETRHLAFSKETSESVLEFLGEILSSRIQELKNATNQNEPLPNPYYIVIFGSKKMVEKSMVMNQLFSGSPYVGVTSIFLFDDYYQLPPECSYIVDLKDVPCCYQRNQANDRKFFTPDKETSVSDLDAFARRMSAIELEGFARQTSLPQSLTFLEGLGVSTVEEINVLTRWSLAESFRTLAAPIGKLAGNVDFFLDIHEKAHGPHGLVAGTTGSGKSELLQTWILSMACTYHPHDVSFVLIDYKGGGMANLLEPLPHVVGKITNLGTNINRSLVSLMSELKRRQVIFDQYGVNHIDKYQKLFKLGSAKEPLPHLIIVADEFAELKKEEPEFMSGLIRAARIGRSLGVHLVLATQKPGGVVDDQIQSNSRFRLCLKVQDSVDSREMIKRPDAAFIRQAGRAYIRVGEDEYFDLFQSYWSGAPYYGRNMVEKTENTVRLVTTAGSRIDPLKDERKQVKSDLDEITAVARYIAETAKRAGIQPVQGPWLPELPEDISLDDLHIDASFDGEQWGSQMPWLSVPIGMYDLPARQMQGVQCVDFAKEGHLAIYGAPGTGKTTLLKTIITSLCRYYTPEDVNIYIIDCGGWGLSIFSSMPHVGGVALDCEDEKVEKLVKLITNEFSVRKKLFVQNAVSSLSAYRESVEAHLPAVILVIDNIAPIFELYPDLEAFLLKIASEGTTYGIYLVYTSNSTSGVRYKIVQNMKNSIAFELTDRGDFASIVGRLEPGMSLPRIKGRAFAKGNPPVEFQMSWYANGINDRERTENLKSIAENMNHHWKGDRPLAIPVMPDIVSIELMLKDYKEREILPLGIDRADISTDYSDLSTNLALTIVGTKGSGKSQLLCRISSMITTGFEDTELVVFDSNQCALEELKTTASRYALGKQEDEVNTIVDELIKKCTERKKLRENAIQNSQDDPLKELPLICIVVDDLVEFVTDISDEARDNLARICRLAKGYGLVLISAMRMDEVVKVIYDPLVKTIVDYQNGLTTSGTPKQHSYFVNNLSYNEKDKELEAGCGYLYSQGTVRAIKYL